MVTTSTVEASCEKIEVSRATPIDNGIYKLTSVTGKKPVWKHEKRDRFIMVNPNWGRWVIADSDPGVWHFSFQIAQAANPWDTKWSGQISVTCIGGSNVSTDCKCGVANSRTARRRILCESNCYSDKNEFPWQVVLSLNEGQGLCGGSIISKKEILTAAHCVDNKNVQKMSVMVGDHNRGRPDGEEKFTVCSKVQHPDYSRRTINNDFAILTLCDEITFNEKVSPICLPESAGREASLNEGKFAKVIGWGQGYNGTSNFILQKATVKTMSNNVCQKIWGRRSEITDQMICAEDPTDNKDKNICFGDSGGPLAVKEGRSYVQIGVNSYIGGGVDKRVDGSRVCARVGLPGVYARVTAELDWIKSNMASSTCPRA